MHVREVYIKDIHGLGERTFKAGAVNVITGDNATGKTSILQALACVFEGGHDPSHITHGKERGEVKITLSTGHTIHKVITLKESKLTIKALDGSIVPKPATFVQQLANGFALNPTALIDAAAKDRAKFLLEAMPIEFTAEELAQACEGTISFSPDGGTYDLEAFNAFLAGREEARTEANRVVRDRQGMRNSLKATLPEGDEEVDWRAKEAEIEESLTVTKRELQALLDQAKSDVNLLKGEIRENAQKEIDDIRAEMEARIAAVRGRVESETAALEAKAADLLAAERRPLDEKINHLSGEREAARVKAAAQLKAAGVRAQIKRLDDELHGKCCEVVILDRVIDRLRALKQKKLEQLPIEGVEVRNGKILVNGLDFDTQLNTAEQYKLSFQIAALKVGRMPIMVCDKAESLNDENFEMICTAIREAGYQLFITQMKSAEPLQVTAA